MLMRSNQTQICNISSVEKDTNANKAIVAEEFARLLRVVVHSAPDLLSSLLWADNAQELVFHVCPALRQALSDGLPLAARSPVDTFCLELERLAPTIFFFPFPLCPISPSKNYFDPHRSCTQCVTLNAFLHSAEKSMLLEKEYRTTHIIHPWLTIVSAAESEGHVVVEKTYLSPVYTALCKEIAALCQLLA